MSVAHVVVREGSAIGDGEYSLEEMRGHHHGEIPLELYEHCVGERVGLGGEWSALAG